MDRHPTPETFFLKCIYARSPFTRNTPVMVCIIRVVMGRENATPVSRVLFLCLSQTAVYCFQVEAAQMWLAASTRAVASLELSLGERHYLPYPPLKLCLDLDTVMSFTGVDLPLAGDSTLTMQGSGQCWCSYKCQVLSSGQAS